MSGPSTAMIRDSGVGVEGEFIKLFSDVTGFFHFVAKYFVTLIASKERDPAKISDIVPPDPASLPPVSSIADRYTRSMLECMVGYPLYSPKPFSELSMEYPRNGVNIGDVGFIRGDGVFDFLFNICPSQNGLINPPDLSDCFSLATRDDSKPRNLEPLPRNTCLFPKTVTKSLSGEYICKGPEGAALILPEGAIQYEAINTRSFEDLAKCRGVDWYNYAMERGRSIPNGSLYLVTSFTKCTEWGIAVFDRPCDAGQGLTFGSSPFSWNGFGALTTKVSNTNQRGAPNQCIFLRGYRIKLRKDIFDNLYHDQDRGSDPAISTLSRQAGSSRLAQRLAQYIGGGRAADLWSKVFTNAKPSTHDTNSTVKKTDEVLLHADFNSSPFHPSDAINAALLSQNLDAKVAITHDDVWCDLLRDNFPTLNYTTLIGTAHSYTPKTDKYGCVSLQKISDSSNVVDRETETPALQESKTGIKQPSARIEETPPESCESSFLHKAKKKLQNLFSIRSSHTLVTSKGSQRGKSREYPADNTANPKISDENKSVEIKTWDDSRKSLKPGDRQMRSASEEAEVGTDDAPANLTTVDADAKDEIDRQDRYVVNQALEQTGDKSVLRKQFTYFRGANRSDRRAEKLGGVGGSGSGRR